MPKRTPGRWRPAGGRSRAASLPAGFDGFDCAQRAARYAARLQLRCLFVVADAVVVVVAAVDVTCATKIVRTRIVSGLFAKKAFGAADTGAAQSLRYAPKSVAPLQCCSAWGAIIAPATALGAARYLPLPFGRFRSFHLRPSAVRLSAPAPASASAAPPSPPPQTTTRALGRVCLSHPAAPKIT